MERNDSDEEREMFRSDSVQIQRAINNLSRKYSIPDINCYRAPKKGEYMLDPKAREIVVFVVHLETKLRFPLYYFFIWLIKKFWI